MAEIIAWLVWHLFGFLVGGLIGVTVSGGFMQGSLIGLLVAFLVFLSVKADLDLFDFLD